MGAERFEDWVKRLPAALKAITKVDVRKAAARAAKEGEELAKSRAPVRTGRLVGSIRFRAERGHLIRTEFPNDYAAQEFGSRRNSAIRFMRDGHDEALEVLEAETLKLGTRRILGRR